MIIFAAMLASGQALPWIDRPWLKEQVRLEALASWKPKQVFKPATPAFPVSNRKLLSFENTVGM